MNLADIKKNFVLIEQSDLGVLMYNEYEKLEKQMFLFICKKGIQRTFMSHYSKLLSTKHNKSITISSEINLDYCYKLFNLC
jgi:hypothetical protein